MTSSARACLISSDSAPTASSGACRLPDEACLYYTVFWRSAAPTAQGLRHLLEDYFGVPVEVLQFTGTWNRLPS